MSDGNLGEHYHDDVSHLLFGVSVATEQDLQDTRQLEDFKPVQFLFHEVVDPFNISFSLVVVEPQLQSPREALPDVLVPVLQRGNVVVDLLNSTFLGVWDLLLLEVNGWALTI